MTDNVFINVADFIEGNGKTYRENNMVKEHEIAIGRLVECIGTGLRLWVWGYGRDCDGTPLYHLTLDRELICKEVCNSIPTQYTSLAVWREGIDHGKIIWNAGSDESIRIVDVHIVDETKERKMFEAGINPHSRQRNEVGDYVLPSIQAHWVGWIERAMKKEYITLDTEMWKNPHIDINKRLEIVDGAVAWRNEVIAQLRRQLADLQKSIT